MSVWIQTRDSDGRVTRCSADGQCSARTATTDHEVAAMPDHEPGDVVYYDGTFNVDTSERKAAMDAPLLAAYRKWQDALALDLSCEPDCKAAYDTLKAAYDAL
jgi:hypothetical protein